MNGLQIFENDQFGKIRTFMIDGDPWFVGNDVAKALGYGDGKSPTNAVKRHVFEEDKRVIETVTQTGTRNITVINESGVYALIFGSKLESAKRFKLWVTSDVLPTLRKTGSYIAPGREPIRIEPPAVPLGAIVRLMEFQERLMRDKGCTAFEIAAAAKGLMDAYGVPVTKAFAKGVDPQMCLFEPVSGPIAETALAVTGVGV